MIAIGDALLLSSEFEPFHGMQALDVGMWSSRGIQQTQPYSQRVLRKRHSALWNVLFCDGHVGTEKASLLFNREQPRLIRRWNSDNLPHLERVPPL
jgi:prepilin-type processing-associated H-X9-DG protein